MSEMEIQHFSHQHSLTFCMLSDQEADDDKASPLCDGCTSYIHGPAYTCKDCNFWLHKSCSELPREIEKHPFHSAHLLYLHYFLDYFDKPFICDGCQELCCGLKYFCESCSFFLDIKCACLTSEEAEASKRAQPKSILHFSHDEQLTWCIVRKELSFKCLVCNEIILGAAYICIDCRFILHESCLNDISQELVEHPFHPQHRLLPQVVPDEGGDPCNACYEVIVDITCFRCGYCSFYLHPLCAKYRTRAIQHEFHEHDLLYFGSRHIGRCRKCHYCGEDCSASFFCCVVCEVDIHLECLPLPFIVKHNRHLHPLKLVDSIVEDDLGGYYCNICETERNPEDHVYYCEECNYTTHIDCVISQVDPEKILSYLVPRIKKVEIQHISHEHSLTLCMLSDQEADDDTVPFLCDGCPYYIHGPAYTCKICNFWLHKSCAELPNEIEKHPFHSAHLLCLQEDVDDFFMCDGCHGLCFGLKYFCKWCIFSLDIRCACLTYEEAEASKGVKALTTIFHFSHHHQLTCCNVREELSINCLACKKVILGSAYVCLCCRFILHESCLNDIPEEVEHPFHPQHHLLPQPMEDDTPKICNACCEEIKGIAFKCDDCSFYSHVSCIKYETRTIKHQFHEHDLLYFGPTNIGRHCSCNSCGEECTASFFCCVICNFDIHLECLPLPLIVKHNRHSHPLTLRYSIVGDDLGRCYCDFCKTERNPEHHVYYCEECNHTTHIDCVISQVEPPEEILSYLVPRTKKVAAEQENDEIESKMSDSEAEKESNSEELIHGKLEEGKENLQEEEEGLIGSLELVQAWLKNWTVKLLDLMKKRSTKYIQEGEI